MSRVMYDSTNPFDIPADAPMVAGYIDGAFAWSADGWSRFKNAVQVHIVVFASTNAGDVLDVERGDATPDQAPGWVLRRRTAGKIPGVYCNLVTWPSVKAAFVAQKVAQPLYLIAQWDNKPVLMDGAIGKQYADSVLTGKHYDLSIVSDYWPGVDMTTPNSPDDDAVLGYIAGNNRVAMPDGQHRNMFDVDYDLTARLIRVEAALVKVQASLDALTVNTAPTSFAITSTVTATA